MEITGSKIQEILSNKSVSSRYANWIYNILDTDSKLLGKRRFKDSNIKISNNSNVLSVNTRSKRINRIKNCLSYWSWDEYVDNQVLDLKKVQRCKDRYCMNCRSINLSKNIMDFYPIFYELLGNGYKPYLLTLTVPNCSGVDLLKTINNINSAFSKTFYRGFFRDFENGGYDDRLFKIEGAIKVIEITKNHISNTFHPHLHLIVFTRGLENPSDFLKNYDGEYSRKKDTINKLSNADFYIRKKWTIAYSKYSKEKYDKDLLCDIRLIEDDKAVFEVFKYTFKDNDITNYSDFCYIFNALHRKRLRQGYGILYNLKLDNDLEDDVIVDDIKNYLIKNSSEQPQSLTTKINDINKEYNNYTKISRFSSMEVLEELLSRNV